MAPPSPAAFRTVMSPFAAGAGQAFGQLDKGTRGCSLSPCLFLPLFLLAPSFIRCCLSPAPSFAAPPPLSFLLWASFSSASGRLQEVSARRFPGADESARGNGCEEHGQCFTVELLHFKGVCGVNLNTSNTNKRITAAVRPLLFIC